MITINIEKDGNKSKLDPIGWAKRKIDRYHENPNELMVDGAIVMGASLVMERMAYTLNAITRARKK